MKKNTILLFVILLSIQVPAQTSLLKQKIKVPPPVCYASGIVERAAIPPSPEIMNALKSAGNNKSEIIVSYNSTFPAEARQAFEYAKSIWENIIESTVPIYIEANWRSLSDGVLGSCGPYDYYSNFENSPHPDIYYPVALVEKLTKTEITGPGTPDITASFNRNINWYFETDLNTPDTLYDFVTVVLHEMAHGLGFTGFFFVEELQGAYGYNDYGDAATFDLLVTRSNGDHLLDSTIFPNRSETLRNAFVSNVLYNSSPVAIKDGGTRPRLYAPTIWNSGSSIYHLNETTYPSSDPNSLMTHAIGKAEAIHDPGPLTIGIMADLGWKHLYFDFERIKDVETIQPLVFKVGIQSEFDLDSNKLFIVYSTDNFQSAIDTINLVATSTETFFEAVLTPSIQTGTIQYYISAGDVKNRTFRLPSGAPENYFSVTIGPDTEKPVIIHEPIPFFLLVGDSLKISANVDDNLGIDTVYVQYSINNIAQPSFGLSKDTGTLYSGYFNFNISQINDGDIVRYSITAIDASFARNSITEPRKVNYSFIIHKIFEPVEQYINTFDNGTSDFVQSDFTIYTAAGFANGALHSPHPYPSPNTNNAEFNFSTILKHPLILKENGTMTFDEIVLVEPGESFADFGDLEFWDYVIVEGSNDIGNTWLPLVNGYDSRANSKWLTAYNQSIVNQISNAVGMPDMYISREINLLENENFSAGDTILIRFRLYSDPYAHGWGWAIDNLRIQLPVSSKLTALSPGNINVYPNPFSNDLNISVETKNQVSNLQIDIYNIYGQKVKSLIWKNVFGTITETISLGDLKDGMYLLNFQENGERISSVKILKSSNY